MCLFLCASVRWCTTSPALQQIHSQRTKGERSTKKLEFLKYLMRELQQEQRAVSSPTSRHVCMWTTTQGAPGRWWRQEKGKVTSHRTQERPTGGPWTSWGGLEGIQDSPYDACGAWPRTPSGTPLHPESPGADLDLLAFLTSSLPLALKKVIFMAETREQQPLGMFRVPVPSALASTGTWRTVPSTSSRHSQGSLPVGQDGFSDLQGEICSGQGQV